MKKTLILTTALLTLVTAIPNYSYAEDFEEVWEYLNDPETAVLTQLVKNANKAQRFQQLGEIPEIEQNFINLLVKYQNEISSSNVKNDIQKRMLLKKRTKELTESDFNGIAKDWVGFVSNIETLGDNIQIDIEISPNITLRYTSNMNDPLIDTIAELQVNDRVTFSGKLKPSDSLGFQEYSLTTVGSLKSPDFEFNVTEIAK